MKYALFFLPCLFFAGRAHAQAKATFQPEETRLKVVFTKSGMNVVYLNQLVSIKTTQALDSLVKSIPDPQHLKIEYESMNADPEQSLAIIRTLEKCNCHLATKSTTVKE
jgi:hypothetical protein